jgi:hypothetical protein
MLGRNESFANSAPRQAFDLSVEGSQAASVRARIASMRWDIGFQPLKLCKRLWIGYGSKLDQDFIKAGIIHLSLMMLGGASERRNFLASRRPSTCPTNLCIVIAERDERKPVSACSRRFAGECLQ